MTLSLQTCADCGAVQWPRRAVCRHCLSDRLGEAAQPSGATLLACADLHVSLDKAWAARLPVRAGTVLLDAGVQAIVLLDGDPAAGTRVRVRWEQGEDGVTRLFAATAEEGA